ncbi:MAG: hypothetical protein LBL90_13550 [Prevotellaceae bacterium]|jgi:hypothetical protein|nr:hypothetical protein [Prevotellaceae bacterium]
MDYFLKRSLISNFESVCRKGNEQEINTAIEEYIEVIANEPENTYEKLCLQLVDVIMKTNDRPFFKQ